MKYYNWQKAYKEAYASKAVKNIKSVATHPLKITEPVSIEVLHLRAWTELRRMCLNDEMANFLRLARQYDRGERLHDTVTD